MKDIDQLPMFDVQWNATLTVDKQKLLDDILIFLIKELPLDLVLMKQLYHQEKHQELKQQLHKLHGALCYCGVPRLKAIVLHLESKLKNNVIDAIPILFNKLDNEVKCLVEYWTFRQLLSPPQKE